MPWRGSAPGGFLFPFPAAPWTAPVGKGAPHPSVSTKPVSLSLESQPDHRKPSSENRLYQQLCKTLCALAPQPITQSQHKGVPPAGAVHVGSRSSSHTCFQNEASADTCHSCLWGSLGFRTSQARAPPALSRPGSNGLLPVQEPQAPSYQSLSFLTGDRDPRGTTKSNACCGLGNGRHSGNPSLNITQAPELHSQSRIQFHSSFFS